MRGIREGDECASSSPFLPGNHFGIFQSFTLFSGLPLGVWFVFHSLCFRGSISPGPCPPPSLAMGRARVEEEGGFPLQNVVPWILHFSLGFWSPLMLVEPFKLDSRQQLLFIACPPLNSIYSAS